MIRQRNTCTALDVLRPLPPFAGWDDSEIAIVALSADALLVQRTYVLVREGTVPYEFYVLLNGQAELSRGGDPVAAVGPGALIGADKVLASLPAETTVTTLGPARLLAFGPRAINQLSLRAERPRLQPVC